MLQPLMSRHENFQLGSKLSPPCSFRIEICKCTPREQSLFDLFLLYLISRKKRLCLQGGKSKVTFRAAYDSDFRFSLGHKLSYDSDSVASENQSSRLVFTSDGVGVVVGVIRELMTQ